MLIGAHESTAEGLHRALGRGEVDGCEAVQIFTAYNTRWAPRVLSDEEASLFRSERDRLGWPVLSHASYLANLASPDGALRRRSLEALHADVLVAESLGVDGLVMHPGSHVGSGAAAGIRRVAAALGELHRRTRGFRLRILLENTAGQGSSLGASFEELAQILDRTAEGDRLGVCLDTCHAFAAGHALASAAGYARTMALLQRHVGLERVRAFHLNDSRRPRGSRVDRHAHIGEGAIGLRAFRRLVSDPRFAAVPAIVETPFEPDGKPSFARNIATLKALRRSKP